ncbi:hypothetical protein [Moraxella nasicaprae]|uniref:Uncharacterized protein n=1 Tax=Moraxella nasicaprae TaxID=2904122 RepID=A0ABY6F3R9_9GAMM|nr:hypothetical protein [Moraxella nasicaprae]UXZ04725.1 hypothetical protein LU297_09205 [Moraxella nasicaprae]
MNKQTSFNPYSQEMLPEGFKYPKSYLELSKDTSSINWDSPADTIYSSLYQAKLLAEFHLALMGGVGA